MMFGMNALPSWAILGMRFNDRCHVWATDQLTEIEIQRGLMDADGSRSGSTRISMQIRGYTVAEGADWQEAMANLFGGGEWNPDRRGQQRAITEGQRAVGPGQVSIPSDAEIIDAMEHDENKYY